LKDIVGNKDDKNQILIPKTIKEIEDEEYEIFGKTYIVLNEQIKSLSRMEENTNNIIEEGNESMVYLSKQNQKILVIDRNLDELDSKITNSKTLVKQIFQSFLFDKCIICSIIILLLIFLFFLIVMMIAPFLGSYVQKALQVFAKLNVTK
jgi:flagellar biosynthesis/type III secretory pathway M-ring protein FliF/YscJ